MNFNDLIHQRKSIRKFSDADVPESVIREALTHATLAPNTSNLQTWDFYWVKTPSKKKELIAACLSQAAARSARELIVVTADPNNFKRSLPKIQKFVEEVNGPSSVVSYYKKHIPFVYQYGFFSLLGYAKYFIAKFRGLREPTPRTPYTFAQLQTVAVKSAALACQNFVLSITNQGFDSCMMEGFDSVRVKKILGLNKSSSIVMVIAIGKSSERGTWGPRFRIDESEVIHEI